MFITIDSVVVGASDSSTGEVISSTHSASVSLHVGPKFVVTSNFLMNTLERTFYCFNVLLVAIQIHYYTFFGSLRCLSFIVLNIVLH